MLKQDKATVFVVNFPFMKGDKDAHSHCTKEWILPWHRSFLYAAWLETTDSTHFPWVQIPKPLSGKTMDCQYTSTFLRPQKHAVLAAREYGKQEGTVLHHANYKSLLRLLCVQRRIFDASTCCVCRYVQAELVHSRFAMTAVAGILIPGVSPSFLYV